MKKKKKPNKVFISQQEIVLLISKEKKIRKVVISQEERFFLNQKYKKPEKCPHGSKINENRKKEEC